MPIFPLNLGFVSTEALRRTGHMTLPILHQAMCHDEESPLSAPLPVLSRFPPRMRDAPSPFTSPLFPTAGSSPSSANCGCQKSSCSNVFTHRRFTILSIQMFVHQNQPRGCYKGFLPGCFSSLGQKRRSSQTLKNGLNLGLSL